MKNQEEDRNLRIALNRAGRITRAALCRLSEDLDAWRNLETASASAAARIGVPKLQLERALKIRKDAAAVAAEEIEDCERGGFRIVTRGEEEYPRRLFDVALPPPVLIVRGEIIPDGPAAAMVGSRKADAYGLETARRFAREFAAAGLTVVSGFALGVDAASHAAAATAGRTLAVLGCGVDVDYPRGQRELARRVAEQGAVISEFALGTGPRPWRFPVRNRVIAALSDAVVVVRARPRSGSLITAHHAMELGRDVWSVPGRLGEELSRGTNDLIADGALVARDPEEIIESILGPRQARLFTPAPAAESLRTPLTVAPPRPLPEGLAGRILIEMEDGSERTCEDLAARLDVGVDRVLGALLELELTGWIRRDPGPVYVR